MQQICLQIKKQQLAKPWRNLIYYDSKNSNNDYNIYLPT